MGIETQSRVKFRQILTVLAAAALLGACSGTPPDIRTPVAGLHAAAITAQSALADYGQMLRQAALDAAMDRAVADRSVRVRPVEGDCRIGAERCRLVLRARDGATAPLRPAPVDANIQTLMSGVVAYTGSLLAIAETDLEAEVAGAAARAKVSILDLAGAVDKLSAALGRGGLGLAARASGFADPVAGAVSYALERRVDRLKFAALRDATARMGAIFPDVTQVFAAVATQAMETQRTALQERFLEQRLAYDTQPPARARLAPIVATADALDAALAADGTQVFTGLEQAHDALRAALAAPELSFATVRARLEVVAAEARKLGQIATALARAINRAGG